eukprot:SAG11_NODE_2267_length_3601_cov_2.234723_4_plen_252_part_00
MLAKPCGSRVPWAGGWGGVVTSTSVPNSLKCSTSCPSATLFFFITRTKSSSSISASCQHTIPDDTRRACESRHHSKMGPIACIVCVAPCACLCAGSYLSTFCAGGTEVAKQREQCLSGVTRSALRDKFFSAQVVNQVPDTVRGLGMRRRHRPLRNAAATAHTATAQVQPPAVAALFFCFLCVCVCVCACVRCACVPCSSRAAFRRKSALQNLPRPSTFDLLTVHCLAALVPGGQALRLRAGHQARARHLPQ